MCGELGGVAPLPAAWTSLAAAFAARVAAAPDAVALIAGDERVTYGELAARAHERAAALRTAGIAAGDPVGLALPRSLAAVTALLALFELGARVVPIDPAWPAARRARVAADAGLVATLAAAGLAPHARPTASAARGAGLGLYTSGSTGAPKGVLLGEGALLWRLHSLALALPYAADDVACHRTPLTFVDAYAEILGPLLAGVPAHVLPHPLAIGDLAAALAAGGITRVLLVPALLALLLDACPDLGARAPALRVLVASGEPLPDALARRVRAAVPGVRLVNVYGSTEVAGDATLGEVGERVTIGAPLPGVRVQLGDDDELLLAGPILAEGYAGDAARTAARFPCDASGTRWFRTGDRARWLPSGELELLGRIDDQVKLGGVRIELGEVEHALGSHPAVRAVAAALALDADGRARLVAGVVAHGEPIDRAALRAHAAALLPAAAVPSLLAWLPALPRSAHGKLDRAALAAAVLAAARGAEAAPAGDPLVAQACAWFAAVTGGPDATVAPAAELEAIGGDSLARLELLVQVDRAGWALGHADLPRPLTPASLAAVLRARPRAAAPAAAVATAALPLTDYQRVMVLDSLANRGAPMWLDQLAVTLVGALDAPRLARAWADEIAAQPALRTVFDIAALTQRVEPAVTSPLAVLDLRALAPEVYRQRVRAEEWTRLSTVFDLARAPLFRLALLSGPAERHDLIFTYHHAILDGESARRVLRAVLARYASRPTAPRGEAFAAFVQRPRVVAPLWHARLADHRAVLPADAPLPTGMGDAPWRLFHGLLAARARLAAWRVARHARRLRPALAAAALAPAAYAGGDLASAPLAAAQTTALAAWARARGTTPTAVWATLFALHLAQERATDDVLFGVVVAGRDGRSAETIGMLANCLPLRVRVAPSQPIAALVAAVDSGLRELAREGTAPLLAVARATGVPARAFLDTLFLSWAYPADRAWSPPAGLALHASRGVTLTSPHTALMVSPGELAVGARAFHRTDRIRRHVLALADALLAGAPTAGALLAVAPTEAGFAIGQPALC